MRLRSAVLELMRGAAGASLVVAVGCSGSEPIRQDDAVTLAPLPAAQPSPAPTPPVVLTATAPDVGATPVVVTAPSVEPVAVERTDDERTADQRVAGDTAMAGESAASEPVAIEARRRRGRPHPIAISAPPHPVARPCGRG